jgi:hypothetical protein
MPKKCVSHCIKLEKKNCTTQKKCTYINGDKRKYCSLSRKYKMDPPSCNVTRKYKKTDKEDKEDAAKLIQKVFRKSMKTKRTHKEDSNKKELEKQQNAAKKLAKFMLKTGDKRKALFLKTICSDSGACISFGTEIAKINKFFNNFTTFEYAISPVKSIGEPSANGFVKEITYDREGYKSYSVLKSSSSIFGDNLMYEYEVGQFINKQIQKFPCFVETYGLYKYKDHQTWFHAKDKKENNIDLLKNGLDLLNNIDYSVGCAEFKHIAILIQHVKKPISIHKFVESIPTYIRSTGHGPKGIQKARIQNQMNNLVHVLYQIYFPLVVLRKKFTHYDLHYENVLLYEPIPGKYITYNYHSSGSVVTFESPYIAKIIDYGRSFYYDTDSLNSRDTYDKICKIAQCKQCGKNQGLEWLNPIANFANSYSSSSINNVSHDMRLFHMVSMDIINNAVSTIELKKLFQDIKYDGVYGTSENTNLGYGVHSNRKNNICDVLKALEDYIKDPLIVDLNSHFYNTNYDPQRRIGEFHIYDDGRPMTFKK